MADPLWPWPAWLEVLEVRRVGPDGPYEATAFLHDDDPPRGDPPGWMLTARGTSPLAAIRTVLDMGNEDGSHD